jgi:hypothetical protein
VFPLERFVYVLNAALCVSAGKVCVCTEHGCVFHLERFVYVLNAALCVSAGKVCVCTEHGSVCFTWKGLCVY